MEEMRCQRCGKESTSYLYLERGVLCDPCDQAKQMLESAEIIFSYEHEQHKRKKLWGSIFSLPLWLSVFFFSVAAVLFWSQLSAALSPGWKSHKGNTTPRAISTPVQPASLP